ncbi:MAG: helix-turn-helix transcriptional regulator [Eubacterium sp.]|nr:helix-turn-helix transcriptional regulator [Eubacterium sp.]
MKMESIGVRIREMREQKSWSQEALACDVDLSTVYIGMIERGEKVPRLQTFLRIVRSLGTTPNDLLVGLFPEDKNVDSFEFKYQIERLSKKDKKKIYKILEAFFEED